MIALTMKPITFDLNAKTEEIKAIFFNVDDVLMNTRDASGDFLWAKNIEQDLGIKKKHFNRIFEGWDSVLIGEKESKDYFADLFQNHPDFQELKISSKDFIEYALRKDQNVNIEMLQLYDDVKIPKYLATNQGQIKAKHIVDILKVREETIFVSCKMGCKKPSRLFFQKIEEKLGLPAKTLLLVDHKKENVQGALSRGGQAYHYAGIPSKLRDYLKKRKVLD